MPEPEPVSRTVQKPAKKPKAEKLIRKKPAEYERAIEKAIRGISRSEAISKGELIGRVPGVGFSMMEKAIMRMVKEGTILGAFGNAGARLFYDMRTQISDSITKTSKLDTAPEKRPGRVPPKPMPKPAPPAPIHIETPPDAPAAQDIEQITEPVIKEDRSTKWQGLAKVFESLIWGSQGRPSLEEKSQPSCSDALKFSCHINLAGDVHISLGEARVQLSESEIYCLEALLIVGRTLREAVE